MTDPDLSTLYSALQEVIRHVVGDNQPTVFMKDGRIEDLAPVDLSIYDGQESQRFDTVSLAIDAYLKQMVQEEDDSYVDPEMEKLKKRIEKQRMTVEEYLMECEDLKKHADVLYTEYAKTDELLRVLKEQSSKITWEKLKAGAMKIPFVKDIDPSKNSVTAVIGG